MTTIPIDFDIYLPTPSTYYSYFELLKAYHFIKPDFREDVYAILQNFAGTTKQIEKISTTTNKKT